MTDHVPTLGPRGRAFWDQTLEAYELSPGETVLLEEACRTLDTLDLLDQAMRDGGAMIEGSRGQQVINSVMTEARGQRAILHRLLAALALPDEEGDAIATAITARNRNNNVRRYATADTEANRRRRGV